LGLAELAQRSDIKRAHDKAIKLDNQRKPGVKILSTEDSGTRWRKFPFYKDTGQEKQV
jgi:hypothetical protein